MFYCCETETSIFLHNTLYQRRANSNPDLELNEDLASFPNPVDLDLNLKIGLNLDLNLRGFALHSLIYNL